MSKKVHGKEGADLADAGDPAERAARLILESIVGDLPDWDARDLNKTPGRMVKALAELLDGYQSDPVQILDKQFPLSPSKSQVIVRDLPFISMCEHHVMPFFGTVSVAYLPSR